MVNLLPLLIIFGSQTGKLMYWKSIHCRSWWRCNTYDDISILNTEYKYKSHSNCPASFIKSSSQVIRQLQISKITYHRQPHWQLIKATDNWFSHKHVVDWIIKSIIDLFLFRWRNRVESVLGEMIPQVRVGEFLVYSKLFTLQALFPPRPVPGSSTWAN